MRFSPILLVVAVVSALAPAANAKPIAGIARSPMPLPTPIASSFHKRSDLPAGATDEAPPPLKRSNEEVDDVGPTVETPFSRRADPTMAPLAVAHPTMAMPTPGRKVPKKVILPPGYIVTDWKQADHVVLDFETSYLTYLEHASNITSKACKSLDMADMSLSIVECYRLSMVQMELTEKYFAMRALWQKWQRAAAKNPA